MYTRTSKIQIISEISEISIGAERKCAATVQVAVGRSHVQVKTKRAATAPIAVYTEAERKCAAAVLKTALY